MSNDRGAAPKRASRSVFARSREARCSELTHDRIAEDVAAFTEAGGKIEVLGNTPMLKTIGAAAEAERTAASAAASAHQEHGRQPDGVAALNQQTATDDKPS